MNLRSFSDGRRLGAAVVLLGWLPVLHGGPARLLKDTNPDASQSSSIAHNSQGAPEFDPAFRVVNGIGYFIANDGIHGSELWRTDGTAAGTFMTADLYPGENGGAAGFYSGFADVNGRLVFNAASWMVGSDLHVSSGTPATTVPLKDLDGDNALGYSTRTTPILAGNGKVLYFAAPVRGDITYGRELWRTDGTTKGTWLVKDIAPDEESGVAQIGGAGDHVAAMLGDVLIFSGYDERGVELWKSDGTEAGTALLKDIGTGTDSFHDSSPQEYHQVGPLVYFSALTEAGQELWRTDGTAAGTFMLTDITPGLNPTNQALLYSSLGRLEGAAMPNAPAGDPQFVYKANRYIKVTLDDGSEVDVNVDRLLLTHGDARPPIDLAPAVQRIIAGPIAAGNYIWMLAYAEVPGPDGPIGRNGLWRVDAAGATFVATAVTDSYGELAGTPTRVFALNELSGVMAFNAVTGQEIAGASVAHPVNGDPPYTIEPVLEARLGDGYYPRYFFGYGDRLFFMNNNGVVGEEPWVSDGTAAGTHLLKDINRTTASSLNPNLAQPLFLNAGGRAVFRGTSRLPDFSSLYEKLFISDGTTAGTAGLDLAKPSIPNLPWGVELGGNILYGDEDGLAALRAPGFQTPVALQSTPQAFLGRFAKAGTQAFFTCVDVTRFQQEGVSESALWRTDGTLAGTRKLAAFVSPDLITGGPTALGNKALFFIQRPGELEKFWVSDGTAAGTGEVMQMESMNDMVIWRNTLWFPRSDGIWTTDGTAAGTRLAVPFVRGGTSLHVTSRLAVFNDALWFGGYFTVAGQQGTIDDGGLIRSDGTDAGTTLVVPRAMVQGAAPVVAGGHLYWMHDQPFDTAQYFPGNFLHRTTGSLAGTEVVRAFPFSRDVPGYVGNSLCAAHDTIFFCFDDGVHGAELWRSDGTEQGTRMVQDIVPGAKGSFTNVPTSVSAVEPEKRGIVTEIGAQLYFWADGREGAEPWVMDVSSLTIPAPTLGVVPAQIVTYLFERMDYAVPLTGGGTVEWAAYGTPPGIVIDPSTGVLSGHPTWPGTYPIVVDAVNAGATASTTVKVRVVDRDALFPTLSTPAPGQLSITTGGEHNALYTVEVSADLNLWIPVATDLEPETTVTIAKPASHLYVRCVVQFL